MQTGELMTSWTIRLALTCYFLGAAARFLPCRPGGHALRTAAKTIWVIGGVVFLGHVAAAFHTYHDWSHHEAFDHVAAETERMIGWRFGGGIYFNYAFGVLWLVDIVRWLRGEDRSKRSSWITSITHIFLLFIVVNGLAIFKDGGLRWFGAIGTMGVLLAWALSWAAGRRTR